MEQNADDIASEQREPQRSPAFPIKMDVCAASAEQEHDGIEHNQNDHVLLPDRRQSDEMLFA
jgi:hypothetical protein